MITQDILDSIMIHAGEVTQSDCFLPSADTPPSKYVHTKWLWKDASQRYRAWVIQIWNVEESDAQVTIYTMDLQGQDDGPAGIQRNNLTTLALADAAGRWIADKLNQA